MSKWACLEYIEKFTIFLVKSRELVIRIIYLIFILVVLKTLSLIANNLVSGAVVLLVGVFEDNIW